MAPRQAHVALSLTTMLLGSFLYNQSVAFLSRGWSDHVRFPHITARGADSSRRMMTMTTFARRGSSSTAAASTAAGREPLNGQFPDLTCTHKLNSHTLLEAPSQYNSLLYLCEDVNQDFAVWPAGFETLHRVCSESRTKPQAVHVPINVTTDLSFEVAERIISTLDRMEGPTLIASASGRRASAVKSMYMALCGGLSPAQAISLATANNVPFVQCPALREWVMAVVARHSLNHHLALHQLHGDNAAAGNAFVVGCCETMEGVLIDPKDESIYAAHNDLMGLQLRYIFSTKTGIVRPVKTIPSDEFIQLKDGDHISFGNNRCLEVLVGRRYCLVADDRSMAFTGDLITPLRSGEPVPINDEHDALELYDSLASRLLCLPRETMMFHQNGPTTTVAAEKSANRLLGQARRVFAHHILTAAQVQKTGAQAQKLVAH